MVQGKPFCSVCGGPREDWSQLYTCKSCHRARVRESGRRRKDRTGSAKKPQEFCSRCHDVRTGRHPSYCIPCWQAKAEERRLHACARCGADREVTDRMSPSYCNPCARENWLMRKYGMTPADFEWLLAEQDHRCAICECVNNGRPWHVDHCHETGAVRGILCDVCNRGLGNFQESEKLLLRAADYLDRVPPAFPSTESEFA